MGMIAVLVHNMVRDRLVNLDVAGNNDTVGLTVPSNRRVSGVDLSILPDDVDNTDISGGYYNLGLDISPKRQRVRQLNLVLSDGLSLHVSRMPVADNGELQSLFASIGYINRFSTTRRQHNDAAPYSAHGGMNSQLAVAARMLDHVSLGHQRNIRTLEVVPIAVSIVEPSFGDMLGAIVYETGPESDMDYDIVLEERSGYL
nr:hypothetical protein [Tanacetum cinerariifolium]